MVKLTHKNYYSPSNTALSNSKVGDYLRSPSYFFKRHILHSLDFEKTASVKVGQIVDAILSKGSIPFQVQVRKMDNAELFESQKSMDPDNLCTQDQMEEGIARAGAVMSEPIYSEYGKKTEFQKILQWKLPVKGKKRPIDICGMIDALTIDGTTAYIDDFKSVSEMKVSSPQRWLDNCLKMGYHRQMGAYGFMLKKMKPKLTSIICRHIVVTKHADSLYKVYPFILGKELLQFGLKQFLSTIEKIVNDTTFKDPPVTWDTASVIELNEWTKEYVTDDEDE